MKLARETKLQLLRYGLVGGIAYAVEMTVIVGLQRAGLSPVSAVAISFVIGTLLSFILHKVATFRDKKRSKRVVGGQVAATFGLALMNWALSVAAVKFLVPPFSAVLVRSVMIVAALVWNYLLFKYVIFSERERTFALKGLLYATLGAMMLGVFVFSAYTLFMATSEDTSSSDKPHIERLALPDNFLQKDCKTDVNVVAHTDDDLLFINPDISESLAQKKCQVTVYVTAGDAGRGLGYVASRELGVQKAYNLMLGEAGSWKKEDITYRKKTFHYMRHSSGRVALVFMRIPDGGINGRGFNGRQSFDALDRSTSPLDSPETTLSGRDVVAFEAALFARLRPVSVRTSWTNDEGDHPDHKMAGRVTKRAHALYRQAYDAKSVVKYYQGYPAAKKPENLSQPQSDAKRRFFAEYAKYDETICTPALCNVDTTTYVPFYMRRYVR